MFNMGIDIGSTTIKIIILDENNKIIFNKYERHFSDIDKTLVKILHEIESDLGNINFTVSITGSGGVSLAKAINVNFVQEVVAVADAIEFFAPKTDVAIEIGGEDAKLIYFKGGLDQRMNGICAGGTGSFIDQMANLLHTDALGLNELAKGYKTIYPIAARCGVFAKSDIQPLINDGVPKEDLAASIFEAIVNQTISGLACGKPIEGRVAFLGGPLHFLSELKNRFIDVLKLSEDEVIETENSQFFAALGAGFNTLENDKYNLEDFIQKISSAKRETSVIDSLPPLFNNEDEYIEFGKRHEKNKINSVEIKDYTGDAFLGIDAGSTTTKVVLVSENCEILYSYYANNEGEPLKVVARAMIDMYNHLHSGIIIRSSCVTGYGEALLKAAFKIDFGEIETMAHYKAAEYFNPNVDYIVDIGGQDIKCIKVHNGIIDNIILNEACSAGCGSFIETFAKSLNLSVQDFAREALYAKNPVNLGSRCTVFMNSRVKQAQKEGASVADISSGLAYSVVKNALQKVIKIPDLGEVGKNIVVQGGTFYNNAVLRAFEKVINCNVTRTNISGLMGAFGAGLIAKNKYKEGFKTTLYNKNEIENLTVETSFVRCGKCTNNCLLTINKFSDNSKFITGNRCEKGLGITEKKTEVPNLYEFKYNRLFSYYKPLPKDKAINGVVGIPRVLNMYEDYPLWFTFFTELGYSVKLSPKSSKKIYEKGISSIPSETACYPAKLVHGHIEYLIEAGVKFIFYPSVAYEYNEIEGTSNCYNCPIVTSYSENIKNNIDSIVNGDIEFKNPFLSLADKKSLKKRLIEEFSFLNSTDVSNAVDKAWEEQENFRKCIQRKGEETLEYLQKNNLQGIVLAGRPYHVDPEINHGIPELITSYNMAVLTEDSISHLDNKDSKKVGVVDQWTYHSRLYAAANFVKDSPNLNFIQLNSFGCGLDAITVDEVNEILSKGHKINTVLKIDEISNLGSIKIRIRSLLVAIEEGKNINKDKVDLQERERPIFEKGMKETHTILCPQMSPIHFDLLKEAFTSTGYNLVLINSEAKDVVELGLKYVNNDTCYPAIVVIGQIVDELLNGGHDLSKTSILMSQTGGGCRSTNYMSLIRKTLKKLNLEHIPVISISTAGLEKNPGFNYTPELLNRALQAVIYGDLFMKVLYKTRPYEMVENSANELYEKWNEICKKSLQNGSLKEFKQNVRNIVQEFDELELKDISKPVVAVVGEILIKFHTSANNNLVGILENEGLEVVLPGLLNFLYYCLYNTTYHEKYFGDKKYKTVISNVGIKFLESYQSVANKALKNSKRFTPDEDIRKLGSMTESLVSLGNQTGEGWLLAAEVLESMENGIQNFVFAQPFGCLPNHIIAKGIVKEIKKKSPFVNIVSIDYDASASEVNQLNRIKLMASVAHKNLNRSFKDIKVKKNVTKIKGHVLQYQK